ncbi:hypothetical protein VNI00_008322 [Paramarasmius palmivorus]|uniref:Uncharacterized protein n=1 Tax=Paramarasmius palmivorus TaxID=297713 RepID=A0AAW0D0P4_9AGAR
MLVLRVWHLFSTNQYVRWCTALAFSVSLGLSLGFTVVANAELEAIDDPMFKAHGGPGCRVSRPPNFWKIYLPSLVLHTLLYILTAIRAMRNRQLLKDATVAKRLIRDGGLFLFVVLVSVGFSAVGSFLTNSPQINVVVFFSNYLLATTSIAVSRVMFSIHSLAAHLGSDTGFLLSNVELSRVGWRKGTTEGEIIVERWIDEESSDHDVERSQSRLQMSRVGVYDNMPWGNKRRYSS